MPFGQSSECRLDHNVVQADIGRFLEGRRLESQQLIRVIYDTCSGQGPNVVVWIDGKELVFGTKEVNEGMAFVRIMPFDLSSILAFPRGHEIPDPQKKTSGVINSRTTMTLHYASDVDAYVRRMIAAAYALDA